MTRETPPTRKPATPIPADLDHLAVPIGDLLPYSRNPRRGNLAVIAESLAVNGQYRPVVANRRTSEVLAGNHTLQAAQSLGWERLAVTWVDVDDEAAARIVAVDNRANDLAGYDDAALAELLSSLPDLAGTGYDDAALAALLATDDEPVALTDPDAVPGVPAKPTSRPGDLWLLGPHRLLCGDSTNPEAVARLAAGATLTLIHAAPHDFTAADARL